MEAAEGGCLPEGARAVYPSTEKDAVADALLIDGREGFAGNVICFCSSSSARRERP